MIIPRDLQLSTLDIDIDLDAARMIVVIWTDDWNFEPWHAMTS